MHSKDVKSKATEVTIGLCGHQKITNDSVSRKRFDRLWLDLFAMVVHAEAAMGGLPLTKCFGTRLSYKQIRIKTHLFL